MAPAGEPGWKSVGELLSIGTTMVLATMIGLGAGYAADRWLHTAPWLTLVGLGLGIRQGGSNSIWVAAASIVVTALAPERQATALRVISRKVQGNPHQPCPDTRFPAKASTLHICAQETILRERFGCVRIAEQHEKETIDPPLMLPHHVIEHRCCEAVGVIPGS